MFSGVRKSIGGIAVYALAAAAVMALTPVQPAQAACTTSGSIVTCSGTTVGGADGFGDSTQSGLTIDVLSGAVVTGTANDGFNLNTNNTVNNSGTVTGGNIGIQAAGSVTVNNASTGLVTADPGGTAISGDTVTVTNYGRIIAGTGGDAIFANTLATIINYGTISGGQRVIEPATVNVTNYGTISTTETFGVAIDSTLATIANYGTISGSGLLGKGLVVGTGSVVTNHGTISANGSSGWAIYAPTDAIVNNFGTVTANGSNGFGIKVDSASVINNSGTITANGANGEGIDATQNITVTIANSGSISGRAFGILAVTANLNNSGTISGDTGILAGPGSGWTLTNSGKIVGTGGTAIDLGSSGGDTLTFLAGTRIVGDIILGTSAPDTVNIRTGRDIAWLLTFGACGCGGIVNTGAIVNVSGGAPYVIAGDQIATLDPTAFSQADRTLVDFTGFISSLLANRFGEFSFTGTTASAFAPVTGGGADAAIAGALAYANDRRMPNANAYDPASGIAVWSKGFAGARNQSADGPNLGARNVAFGGMIGLDKNFTSDLRLGAFLGAGNGRLDVEMDSQQVKTDYLFGGLYGRFDWTARFFDFAVSGGRLSNSSTRTIANNMTTGGTEQASAKFDGWFLAPEMAYGVRLPMAGGYTLTPAARLRYVAGFFDAYSETGSGQTLSVASRTTQNLEQRLEVSVSKETGMPQGWLKTTATIGALGMERLGDTAFNVVLIGQNLGFSAPGRSNVAGAYAGLNVSYRLNQTASLFAAVEATAMSDKSKTGIVLGGLRIALN